MKIYFTGICGTAMGNAAVLMKQLGHEVMGSDQAVYPPMSDYLREQGIELFNGFNAERLASLDPDLVVIGNAVSRGNSEVEFMLNQRRLPFVSLPELLSREVLSKRRNIVVTGTHGKTTTTALTAFLLRENRQSPGWFIGGVPRDLPMGAFAGESGRAFVIEGDEYDSAFFDKRSKFIHYKPNILIVNNLEFDHADIFRDLQDVKRSFNHLVRIVPDQGYILYNGDDENLSFINDLSWSQRIRVGFGSENDLKICHYKETPEGMRFVLNWRGTIWGKVVTGIFGRYNARNIAMAALASGLVVKPEDPFCAIDLGFLKHFQGVRRRQEIRYEDDEKLIFEDFAHHPTAVAQALESIKMRYPKHCIHACFEPRSNTSCLNLMEKELEEALAIADVVSLAPVHRSDRIPEDQRLNTRNIAQHLSSQGLDASAYSHMDLLEESLQAWFASKTESPKLLIFFSNGAFGGLIDRFSSVYAYRG